MGLYSSFKSSYQSQGIFGQNGNYHTGGFGDSWKANNPGMRRPREGLMHVMKRSLVDSSIDTGNTGMINSGMMGNKVRYGGSVFSSGGWREITHKAQEMGGSGRFMLGARRGALGMFGTAAMKAATPAMFLYTMHNEGLAAATKQTVESSAYWGAARYAWGIGQAALGNPLMVGALAVAATGIAAQKALVMGKKYNSDVRKVSFGNVHNDVYGNAATMRQASVNAIQSSKINGRSALGNEASLMHQR